MQDVHTPVRPDSDPSGRIRASLRMHGSTEFSDVDIAEISPLGISLKIDDAANVHVGEKVDLELVLEGTRSHFQGIVVSSLDPVNSLVGVRFAEKTGSEKPDHDEERRTSRRWICTDNFLPSAIASSPASYNEFVRFTVRDISETGMLLSCSLSNKYLIPNILLDLTVTFPIVGTTSINTRITRVDINSTQGKEYLYVGVRFVKLDSKSKKTIWTYLEQFTEAGLQEHSLQSNERSKALQIHIARNEDDLKSIVQLRQHYELPDANLSTFDNDARLYLARFNGELVATARVRLPKLSDKLALTVAARQELPALSELIEVSAVAVSETVSSTKILPLLFQSITASCVTSGRPFILAGIADKDVQVLEAMGFENTMGGADHQNTMQTNAVKALTGRSVSPRIWNFVWKEVAEYLVDQKIIVPNGVERILMRGYRFSAPILNFIRPRL